MASLYALGQRLFRIEQQLIQSPVMLMGRPNKDEDAEREGVKLEKIATELDLIVRDLKSSEHLVLARQASLQRNVPRPQRWHVSQSLQQRETDVRTLIGRANELCGAVRKLLEKNGLVSPMQRAQKLEELLANLQKTAGYGKQVNAIEFREALQGPAYFKAPAAHPEADLPSLAPVLTVAFLGLKWLTKTLRRERSV